jgi:membrane-associated protein
VSPRDLLDPTFLLHTFGLLGVAVCVFAETGLLIGFFLPGDSLLFSAGILAAAGKLPIVWLVLVAFVAAVAGDSVGYAIGRRAGTSLYQRPEGRLRMRTRIQQAKAFYERRGASTIVLARFIPIIRTFAPLVAGAAEMPYRRFVTYNVLGGLLWGVGVTLAGFALGNVIPNIDRYLLPVIAVVIAISLAPIAIEALRARRGKSAERGADRG